jgi:hypothetical protein
MSERGPVDAHIETMPNGRRFYFDRPEFRIEEIAWHTSHQCRYTGGVKFFYSVLQHMLMCSYLTKGDPLEAMIHDGVEFALNDVNSPAKHGYLQDYVALEKRLYLPMAQQFGIPVEMTHEAHDADAEALIIEADILLPSRGRSFMLYRQYKYALDLGMGHMIQELPPAFVRKQYLARFEELMRDRNQVGATWLR